MNDKNFLNGYFQDLTEALKTLNIADWYQMVAMIKETHIAKKKGNHRRKWRQRSDS